MRELPILFSGEMVRAILDGRKTQTRRIIKPQPTGEPCDWSEWALPAGREGIAGHFCFRLPYGGHVGIPSPYQIGGILWVRETWFKNYSHKYGKFFYRADGEEIQIPTITGETMIYGKADGLKWYPSIHMPKEAARIWLEVTNVRAERLQEITEEDAMAEGVCWYDDACYANNGWSPTFYDPDSGGSPIFRDGFISLWDSIYQKQGHGWEVNDWVWVYEFKRLEVQA